MREKINKYDIALILTIIAVNILILAYGTLNTVDKGKKIAYIYSDNRLVGEYTLTDDYKTEFVVESESGSNKIHIEDGYVWIEEATCPDKICLHQGRISNDGEVIVCLPNRLMVQIKDNNPEDELDVIVK
ncbi:MULTISPECIES: NusG domain II-containing protein [unclassified Sedimentibacter]|uniref:NusG domain II-containing protein n=1 Tax=unclassified Sedimentibacter TaxID=2649220 RepID=UPI0027E1F4A8|nr:NusG domain II-containing protein [Sedimentibacter sp. MB35-C1]WMJ75879.1 NusG domain II-containing protein [Sedimentibacter sp. MB35-C1]